MWIPVTDGALHVETTGRGTPLLMLHGWPLDHRAFAPQLASLSEHLRIIAPDRRGFGASTAPPDLAQEIADIDTLLDTIGVQSVHLLGMSQGARVALRYAVERPERLRSLTVQGAIIDGIAPVEADPMTIPLEAYAALARANRLDALREAWLAHPMMSLDGVSEDDAALVKAMVAQYDGQDLRKRTRSRYAYRHDVLAGLATFSHPALLITGAMETPTRHAHAELLARTLPDARHVTLQHSGHLCNLSEPSAFNDIVLEFVQTAEAAR